MIDLTIKTLDSQNHAFSVDDDITVAQFKEKIAEVINIPVESQRLIYCGRVLQDAKKLQEYDVNGKVVHLVQRAPPSATRRSRSPIMTGNNRRPFTNAMYLGSMAFPTGLMEAQGMVRPPPTQSLSGSRLAVARRMIRRAENILNNLEGGTRSRESPPEEPQDDVTPVFAAQVFVPHTSNDDALAASLSAAVSAVENGILQAEQSMQAEPTPSASTASSTEQPEIITPDDPPIAAGASTSEQPDASSSAEGQTNGRSRTRGLPRNSYGTIEMSRLLDDLNKIHERLQPYMERYHTFMRTDPVVTGEQETRDTQQMINRVSEIMHLLGHAYHSLSDVMVQVSTPAPRPLLCRPILIQHSAVVQAGIPIQVEAQINLTPDRRPSDSNSSQTQTQTESQGSTTNGNGSGATSATPGQTQPQPQAHMQPNVHEIRIDSFPFEFRGFQRHPMFNISTAQARPQGQATNQAQAQAQAQGQTAANQAQSQGQAQAQGQENQSQAAPPPTGNNDSGSQATETNTNANTNAPAGQQQEPFVAVVPPFSNNPNMEFFMEVTPESITIDSLETTVVTSAAQADNVLRGTFGGVPAEFIQSLMLHAIGGEVMGTTGAPNANGNGPVGNIATFEFPANATANDNSAASESNQTGTSTANAAANGSNVNSQARGNTQTHPTTSTQTRSTARPHEHLAQHTMQGFDPFLPCNSHHIHRRRMPVTATTVVSAASGGPASENNPTTAAGNEQQNNNQVPNPIYNILQGLLRSLGNTNLPREAFNREESATSATSTTAAPSAPPPPSDSNPISLTLDFADLTRMLFDNRSLGQSTTLASVLQNFPDHQYTEGDSLFTDLVMTLARGLTFSDVIALNTGHIEPLVRIRPTLRTFFRNRVLEGECPTQAAIDRGANRLITELQPILELMSTMRVRDNIDIVESATQLCRTRFPNIISLLMSRMTGSLRSLVDLCLLTIRQLCALALHSCEDGQAGVEEVFRALIARYTVGVSPDIHQWTITTSLTQIRHFLRTLDVSPASIQPYIVVKSTDTPSSITEPNILEPEAMECEDAPVVETSAEPPAEATNLNPVTILEDETDPLPNVVIGSEPWHCGLQTDWIPIITRDNQRQRRQNPQAPFSDAYLSGMPSKRRKIVASAKPQGNLSQVISDGVRRAVTASGLSNAVPLDAVSQAASADLTLQSAYRDLLRTSVQSELRDNPDFTPERFPNAANYFNINK